MMASLFQRGRQGILVCLLAILLDVPVPLEAHAQDAMEPPGDCTQDEHRQLKQAVGRACKSESMTCSSDQECAELWSNLIRYQGCIAARQLIADRCFRGGDKKHQDEIANYKTGAERCRKYIMDKRCPPPACN
jgi:hypothetical protein